jgi:hypothetical protein
MLCGIKQFADEFLVSVDAKEFEVYVCLDGAVERAGQLQRVLER